MDNEASQGFIVHTRAFRDTALLVELFTLKHGRVGAVANNIFAKKNNTKALLQAFSPLNVVLYGKGDLLRLKQVEARAIPISLLGMAQVCGFYVNELVMYCLTRHDPQPLLFTAYQQCLYDLSIHAHFALTLRVFELTLLSELGYGINFLEDYASLRPIEGGKSYAYLPQWGFCEYRADIHGSIFFEGEHLLAMHALDFSEPAVLKSAKQVTRLALQPLLNGRKIHSRTLFT